MLCSNKLDFTVILKLSLTRVTPTTVRKNVNAVDRGDAAAEKLLPPLAPSDEGAVSVAD